MRRTRLRTLLLALTLALPFTGCGGGDVTAPPAATVETTTFAPSLGIDLSAAGWTKNAAGLYTRTLSSPAGAAPTAANGQRVTVRYTGWLANGTQFESSTYAFALGRGEVIAGWDQGIVGMRVGERRQLVIPPSLGYGAQANNVIPANSILVFNVELLSAS
jgi:FKBP-type peptidyl-prolyl cis-trans isomerase